MDVKAIYKRYNQLTWQQQLGNLAATLARISSQASSPESDQLVTASLREAALLIEWSAPHVPSDFLLELAAMQREVLAWQRRWPIDEAVITTPPVSDFLAVELSFSPQVPPLPEKMAA